MKLNEFSITKLDTKNINPILHIANFNIGMMINGKYEIKREISRGGMGIVYEAYDHFSNRQVAIKIILANKIDVLQLKRFEKEIEACSNLSHPNVIKIYDAGTYEKNPYIVMEYIDGVNICEYVASQNESNTNQQLGTAGNEKKRKDWKLCAKLIYETALGLEYIHKKKMFHRDIKPSNIIVRPNGSPVIIDLGLVKFNRERSYNLTRSRDIIGTCQYMPIEQVQGKRGEIDARSDVYSLGLVLYELLTGQQAYTGKNMTDVFNKIMSYYPPLPREINPKIPEILEEITLHATEKQKERRYATAQEFADELKQYLNDTTAKATTKYANYKKRLLLQRNKNKIFIGCIVLLLVIVAVFAKINITYNPPKEMLQNTIKEQTQNQESNQKASNIKDEIETQYKIGLMYEQGQGVQKDLVKACEWYEKAANQGDIQAQCKLADIYYKGQDIQKDYKKAFEWYEKAAKQGDTEAQYRLGWMYQRGEGIEKNYSKAFFWYEKAVEKKYVPAQRELGYLYYNYRGGYKGVKQDWDKAIYFFEQAGNKGDAAAQFALGVMYMNGERVQKDFFKSAEWFEKAASQKNETDSYLLNYISNAQFHLGHVYKYKIGGKENLGKARFWFEQSANQGDQRALHELGVIYLNGQGVKQDLEKAIYWYEKAANKGYVYAQIDLGNLYKSGQEVKQDYVKAREWYEKAAKQGNAEAQYYLACMYNSGLGTKHDFLKAKEWYEKAAEQGLAEAQNNLGVLYSDNNKGTGIEENLSKAFELFEKSAIQGYSYAQYNLANMYYIGRGIKQDLEKAKHWYEKAAKQGHNNAKIKLNEILKKK